MTIDLTEDEYENLVLMLGVASGALIAQRDHVMFWRCVKVINSVGRNSPAFRPYEIPAVQE